MIRLRDEDQGPDHRYLYAWVTETGRLVLHGIDSGPQAPGGDEYEWTQTVEAEHIPRLLEALGGDGDGPVLDQLEAKASGPDSHRLSKLLRDKVVPSAFHLGEVSPHLSAGGEDGIAPSS